MKKRSLAVLLCLIVIFSIGTTFVSAEDADTVVKAQSFFDGILAFNGTVGENGVQEWIDGYLTENAGINSEWYVLALSQYGDYDFSKYESALLAYLEDNTVRSASSRLKYALCLAAVKSTNGYISATLENSVGEQGLMSFVFGLHLLNNGYESSVYTASEVIKKLLDMQCEDGGWSVTGKRGDVDATAMTVQALAPYFDNVSEVRTAIERALAFLSEEQLDRGEYSSYGKANPESTAQVVTALSALGIDCEKDERFVKNGNTLFGVMEKYLLPDGSFCHTEGGGYDHAATVQAFYASVAYMRMLEGKGPLYILDHARPSEAEPAPPKDDNDTGGSVNGDEAPKGGYKLPASLTVVGIGICACVLLVIFKKKNIKNFIAVIFVVMLGVTFILVTDIQTADDYYNGSGGAKEHIVGSVVMSIRCDTVAGADENIPKNGIILDATDIDISEGDTVYTVLTEAARKYKIQFENDGNASYVYISGINYLYEFDYGDLSGWVYTVNGERPSVGAGAYKLKDGDVIEWRYTLDLGNDLE